MDAVGASRGLAVIGVQVRRRRLQYFLRQCVPYAAWVWLFSGAVAPLARAPQRHHRSEPASAFVVASPVPADTICRDSKRAWHRASGDTLWFYILIDRASQRVDTQAVVFAGDSAVQLRPRPRRLGPTQATRLRAMHQTCAGPARRR